MSRIIYKCIVFASIPRSNSIHRCYSTRRFKSKRPGRGAAILPGCASTWIESSKWIEWVTKQLHRISLLLIPIALRHDFGTQMRAEIVAHYLISLITIKITHLYLLVYIKSKYKNKVQNISLSLSPYIYIYIYIYTLPLYIIIIHIYIYIYIIHSYINTYEYTKFKIYIHAQAMYIEQNSWLFTIYTCL